MHAVSIERQMVEHVFFMLYVFASFAFMLMPHKAGTGMKMTTRCCIVFLSFPKLSPPPSLSLVNGMIAKKGGICLRSIMYGIFSIVLVLFSYRAMFAKFFFLFFFGSRIVLVWQSNNLIYSTSAQLQQYSLAKLIDLPQQFKTYVFRGESLRYLFIFRLHKICTNQ